MLKAFEENQNESGRYYFDIESTLITRLLDYKNEYLIWIYDFDIPFTNNLSERTLRGKKSKPKALWQFWNIETASYYATIKTYIKISIKNNALLKLSCYRDFFLTMNTNDSFTFYYILP